MSAISRRMAALGNFDRFQCSKRSSCSGVATRMKFSYSSLRHREAAVSATWACNLGTARRRAPHALILGAAPRREPPLDLGVLLLVQRSLLPLVLLLAAALSNRLARALARGHASVACPHETLRRYTTSDTQDTS